jgi:hypothetical protein
MKFQSFLSFMVGFSMVGGLLFALRWMAHKPLFVAPKALSKADCGRSVTATQTPLPFTLQPPSGTGTFSVRTLMDHSGGNWEKGNHPQTGTLIPNPIDRPNHLTSVY